MSDQQPAEWAVGIVSSREDPQTLSSAIDAVLAASSGRRVSIETIVNGNPALADDVFAALSSRQSRLPEGQSIRVWHIEQPDKANAWNQYLHEIWPGGALSFCIDGYVRVAPDALHALSSKLQETPQALATTGIPSSGRSAEIIKQTMLQQGGFHGNLFAVRGDTMDAMRGRGFRIPVGHYRTDGMLGAVIAFGLDPKRNQWDNQRVVVTPGATWFTTPLSRGRARDAVVHFKRMVRQARGDLENKAMRQYLSRDRKALEHMPETSDELVRAWLGRFPWQALGLVLRKPLGMLSLRKIYRAEAYPAAALAPRLIGTVSAEALLPREAGRERLSGAAACDES